MRPYRLIFYFFKCYLDRVQYPSLVNLNSGVLPTLICLFQTLIVA